MTTIAVLGIRLEKNVCSLVGLDATGGVALLSISVSMRDREPFHIFVQSQLRLEYQMKPSLLAGPRSS